MPFVKLDTGILNSTLWFERNCREIFITSLLMAVPRELSEPLPAIAVRSLDPSGFVVPAGWYGFIESAGIGIANRALLTPEDGLEALEKLCAPDPESRSPEFEGRRMARVSGGYVVLNYMKYRDKDHRAVIRMRNYRERRRSVTSVTDADKTVTDGQKLRNVTQAEAEAEAEAYKDLPARSRSRQTKAFPGNSQSQQTKALGETRHIRVQKIVMGWYQAWAGAECPWNGGEAKQLSDLLKSTPHWPDQQFITCLDNLGKSTCVAIGDRPREWLGRLPKFLKGPLDKFRNPQVNHGENQRTIQNTAATRAAVTAGVDKFLRRKNAVDNQDVPRTSAPIPGNSS